MPHTPRLDPDPQKIKPNKSGSAIGISLHLLTVRLDKKLGIHRIPIWPDIRQIFAVCPISGRISVIHCYNLICRNWFDSKQFSDRVSDQPDIGQMKPDIWPDNGYLRPGKPWIKGYLSNRH